jgi:peptidoglycan/xylan/chitin deacetylase (PgdA/CDA1 family)
MSFEEQRKTLQNIRNWVGVPEIPRPDFLCLTKEQVKELANSSLFNVGGHTVSHPALSFHDKEKQRNEISGNKLFLENHTGKKIDLFAYPSGKYNSSTVEILKELDFKAGFTTLAKSTKDYSSPFTIGRFGVNNWNGDQFEKMLIKWRHQ